MHSHLKILEKYNIDKTQYRTSSLQKSTEDHSMEEKSQ